LRPARQRQRLLLAIAAAGVVLAAAATAGVFRLKRYVDTDPGLCAQCHRASPEFALWKNGSHQGVACQRCHHATPREGLAMLGAFLAGKPPGGKKPHAEVQVGACAACHLSHDPRWKQIEGSRGHRVHLAAKIECVRCHANAMHGFEPPTAACKECHGEHAVRAAGMAPLHCFACHDFLSTDAGLRPTRRDCLRCHRAQGVHPARFSDDAPMQFACGECHRPHARTLAEERRDCTECHPGARNAGLHAARGHQEACARCHAAHTWRAERAGCLACHGGAREHASGKSCRACHSFAGAGTPLPPKPAPPLPAPAATPAAAPAAPPQRGGRAP
jgi:hypothetical protein